MSRAYVIGTGDTKGAELGYVRTLIEAAGQPVVVVDIGIRSGGDDADVAPEDVAGYHPDGARAVFVDDRGAAVAAMARALEGFVQNRIDDIAGVIGLGGSSGTAMIAPAMRALPVGRPKILVSTVASGNVAPYVGPADIAMMYSVTDMAGLNSISRRVLGNAAHALAGMIAHPVPAEASDKPAIGLTMFGVTTPCVERVTALLKQDYECLVFHATGIGGQSMEKLVHSGLVAGVIDVTTTEVCDLMMGGIFSAGEQRLDVFARRPVPYVGSCGALDMVNFGARESVPERYRDRTFYEHNPQVTLMRTTAEEGDRMGQWIANKLNRMAGPVRFLIPEGGISLIDAPGQPFHDQDADRALFDALAGTFQETPARRLVRLSHAINDPAFAEALVENFREIAGDSRTAMPS